MFAGFLDGPTAFLPGFLELPHPNAKILQAFLAFGRLDFQLGGFAVGGASAVFQRLDFAWSR